MVPVILRKTLATGVKKQVKNAEIVLIHIINVAEASLKTAACVNKDKEIARKLQLFFKFSDNLGKRVL